MAGLALASAAPVPAGSADGDTATGSGLGSEDPTPEPADTIVTAMATTPTTDLAVDDIDFGNMALWSRDDIPGMLAKLQEEKPVSWHGEPEVLGLAAGPGYWMVTRGLNICRHVTANPDHRLIGERPP